MCSILRGFHSGSAVLKGSLVFRRLSRLTVVFDIKSQLLLSRSSTPEACARAHFRNVCKAAEVPNLQRALIWIIQSFANRKLTSSPALKVYMHASSSERLLCITRSYSGKSETPSLSSSSIKIYSHKGSLHNLFKKTHIINISFVSYIS